LCDCGATWAAAPTYALHIRYRIWPHTRIKNETGDDLIFSVGKVLSCHWGSIIEYNILKNALENLTQFQFTASEMYKTSSIGCHEPETLIGGWQYLYRFGAFSVPCVDDKHFGVCNSEIDPSMVCTKTVGLSFAKCTDKSAALTFLAGGFYTLNGENQMMKEIYQWGPITSALAVYPDFVTWDGNGVYTWNGKGKSMGGFAVALLGWGYSTLLGKFWIAAAWDRGVIKIKRGVDMAGIESNAISGFPKIPLARMSMPYTHMISEMDTFLANVYPVHATGYKLSAIENGLENGNDIIAGRVDLISEDMIPNFKTMIAAEPKTIKFPHRGKIWRYVPDVFWVMVLLLFMFLGLVIIININEKSSLWK